MFDQLSYIITVDVEVLSPGYYNLSPNDKGGTQIRDAKHWTWVERAAHQVRQRR